MTKWQSVGERGGFRARRFATRLKSVCTGVARHIRSQDGQMVVELAVVTPVMIAFAIVVANLMMYLGAAARFDRVVPDVVMAVAVSPTAVSQELGSSQEHEVARALTSAMEGVRGVEVTVRCVSAWSADSSGFMGFSFAPHLTRYVCTMRFTPWPSVPSIAGIDLGTPAVLEHTRSFTVDRYRTGVVI